MSVPYRMIDIKTSDEVFESLLLKYFDDFKKFIKVYNLECPPIRLVDKFDDLTCACVKNGVLEVSKVYFIALKQAAVSVLYHEFTHVYDDSIITPSTALEKFGLLTYTEFHATVIETMVAAGYTSYEKDKKISCNNKFVDMADNCTVLDYFIKLNKINEEMKVDTSNIKSSFKYMYYHMLYYLGRVYFAQKYIFDEIPVSLEPFIRIFGNRITELKELLFVNDDSNAKLLQLGIIQEKIIQEFDNRYNK